MTRQPNLPKVSSRVKKYQFHPISLRRRSQLECLDYSVQFSGRVRGEPTLSIIVVVFMTRVEYIAECLNSLSSQSSSDFEVILVDNGTSGQVRELIDTFFESHSNVVLLRFGTAHYDPMTDEVDDPTALLWNAGLFCSQAEFIYFLSCDDFVSSNYVHEIVRVSQLNPDCFSVAPRVVSVGFSSEVNFDITGMLDEANVRADFVSGRDVLRGILRRTPLISAPGGLLVVKVASVVERGGFDRVNDLTQFLKYAVSGQSGFARDAELFWRHHPDQANRGLSKIGLVHYRDHRELNVNYHLRNFYKQLGLFEESNEIDSFLEGFASETALSSVRKSTRDYGLLAGARAVARVRDEAGRNLGRKAFGVFLGSIPFFFAKNLERAARGRPRHWWRIVRSFTK